MGVTFAVYITLSLLALVAHVIVLALHFLPSGQWNPGQPWKPYGVPTGDRAHPVLAVLVCNAALRSLVSILDLAVYQGAGDALCAVDSIWTLYSTTVLCATFVPVALAKYNYPQGKGEALSIPWLLGLAGVYIYAMVPMLWVVNANWEHAATVGPASWWDPYCVPLHPDWRHVRQATLLAPLILAFMISIVRLVRRRKPRASNPDAFVHVRLVYQRDVLAVVLSYAFLAILYVAFETTLGWQPGWWRVFEPLFTLLLLFQPPFIPYARHLHTTFVVPLYFWRSPQFHTSSGTTVEAHPYQPAPHEPPESQRAPFPVERAAGDQRSTTGDWRPTGATGTRSGTNRAGTGRRIGTSEGTNNSSGNSYESGDSAQRDSRSENSYEPGDSEFGFRQHQHPQRMSADSRRTHASVGTTVDDPRTGGSMGTMGPDYYRRSGPPTGGTFGRFWPPSPGVADRHVHDRYDRGPMRGAEDYNVPGQVNPPPHRTWASRLLDRASSWFRPSHHPLAIPQDAQWEQRDRLLGEKQGQNDWQLRPVHQAQQILTGTASQHARTGANYADPFDQQAQARQTAEAHDQWLAFTAEQPARRAEYQAAYERSTQPPPRPHVGPYAHLFNNRPYPLPSDVDDDAPSPEAARAAAQNRLFLNSAQSAPQSAELVRPLSERSSYTYDADIEGSTLSHNGGHNTRQPQGDFGYPRQETHAAYGAPMPHWNVLPPTPDARQSQGVRPLSATAVADDQDLPQPSLLFVDQTTNRDSVVTAASYLTARGSLGPNTEDSGSIRSNATFHTALGSRTPSPGPSSRPDITAERAPTPELRSAASGPSSAPPQPQPSPLAVGDYMIAAFDHIAESEHELSFAEGDYIFNIDRAFEHIGWWEGETHDGVRGMFPSSRVVAPDAHALRRGGTGGHEPGSAPASHRPPGLMSKLLRKK